MTKTIKISSLVYEMLLDISKKNRTKPEPFIEKMIQDTYNKKK